MKKIKLPPTLSENLREAIMKDLESIYNEACYETYDYHSALNTLYELGVDAMPNTQAIIKKIEQMENDSFSKLHELWGLEKPFGLSNLW